ncbi:hypothetical protein FUAX_49440 (plasmid) [Fulvitalea axinellae]|uniref:Uncharacterized protein n=1 Tax=Fulvitalea axinellae TaxID=1182444 RepID=A0AAU9D003_9BACT|nr:hypothetical protein FUAX_49440 [Fulvitalea axinellae]
MATRNNETEFVQVGWWVPGSLKPGWNARFQANFNDMSMKFNQLDVKALVSGGGHNGGLGFYFSMAEFDFIQLLTFGQLDNESAVNDSYKMVTYAVWMAAQGWAHFSPIPISRYKGIEDDKLEPLTFDPQKSDVSPLGWYFTGSFSEKWNNDIQGNYEKALAKRSELGIRNLSPLYFCQSTLYGCVQMVQSDNPSAVESYASWFSKEGFGSLRPIPFMDISMLKNAIAISHKTP